MRWTWQKIKIQLVVHSLVFSIPFWLDIILHLSLVYSSSYYYFYTQLMLFDKQTRWIKTQFLLWQLVLEKSRGPWIEPGGTTRGTSWLEAWFDHRELCLWGCFRSERKLLVGQIDLDVGFSLHRLLIFFTFVNQFFWCFLFFILVWVFCVCPFIHFRILALTLQESVVYEVSYEEPNTCKNHDGAAGKIHVLVAFGDINQFPCRTEQGFKFFLCSHKIAKKNV